MASASLVADGRSCGAACLHRTSRAAQPVLPLPASLKPRSHAEEEEEELQLELSALTRSVWYLVCSQLAFRRLVRIMLRKKRGKS